MNDISRRSFVATVSAIPFALWIQSVSAQGRGRGRGVFPNQTRIRYDARSVNGKKMLKIYAEAVAVMQATNAGNPLSWNFQWNTHCVPGSQLFNQQAPQKAAAIAAAFPPGTPAQKDLALKMWGTCQSHYSGLPDYFLPWHRMYVFYLENIVRKVSGHAEFTLPYWNYSVAGADHGIIPKEFRLETDPVFKSLFVKKRNTSPDVNGGIPIDQGSPGSLALTALKKCQYSSVGMVSGFCAELDGGLHGNVHVQTGAAQNMGTVPWAAGDPIFWMHHCNIDRLWASWNKAGRANPTTPAFLNQKFWFASETGQPVEAKIQDVLNIADLKYSYDAYEPVPACLPRINPDFVKIATTTLALSAEPARSPLKVVVQQPTAEKLNVTMSRLRADQRVYLVLQNLSTNDSPGVVYDVFLGMPDAVNGSARDQYRAGVINFFHAAGHGGGGNDNMRDISYSFDVTDLLKRLGTRSALADEPVVTIAPSGRPLATARPIVGEASLVRQ